MTRTSVAPATTNPSLFDRWSASYDGSGLQLLTYRPVHDAVLDRLTDAEPSTLIDLGCGTGQLTHRLTRRFPRADVIGVDLSTGMLTKAAARSEHAQRAPTGLVQANAQQLPFASASVDVIVCTESFHWYREQGSVLDDLAAVLRPGGQLLIASIAAVTEMGERIVRRSTVRGGNAIRALPPRQLSKLLDHSGFEVTHQRRIPRLGLVAWPVLTHASLR